MGFKIKCSECGKELEGLSERHAKTLLLQHQIKHLNDKDKLLKKALKNKKKVKVKLTQG